VRDAIAKHNAPPRIARPFVVKSKDIAPPKKMGGFLLGKIIPLLVIIFAAVGAFYPAIDVTAMEKERGTLETLLLTPTRTTEIMIGKFLSVFLLTMTSVFLNVFSIALTTTHGLYYLKALLVQHGRLPQFDISITPSMALLVLVMMIPTSAIFSSLMMIVAIFARNFKEAQNYMTPLLLFFTAPPLVVLFPGFELNTSTALLPIVNISLLFRDMMVGKFSPMLRLAPLC